MRQNAGGQLLDAILGAGTTNIAISDDQLVQGDFDQLTRHGETPLSVADRGMVPGHASRGRVSGGERGGERERARRLAGRADRVGRS